MGRDSRHVGRRADDPAVVQLKERMLEKKKLNAKKDQQELIANLAIQRKAGKDAAQIKVRRYS